LTGADEVSLLQDFFSGNFVGAFEHWGTPPFAQPGPSTRLQTQRCAASLVLPRYFFLTPQALFPVRLLSPYRTYAAALLGTPLVRKIAIPLGGLDRFLIPLVTPFFSAVQYRYPSEAPPHAISFVPKTLFCPSPGGFHELYVFSQNWFFPRLNLF